MITSLKARVNELTQQLDQQHEHTGQPAVNDTDLIIRLQRDLDRCLGGSLELCEQLHRFEREVRTIEGASLQPLPL